MLKFNFIKRFNIILYVILFLHIFTGCSNGSKYDKLILIDQNTNKKYLIKHNIGDTYFIDEEIIKISGKDTIVVFE
jgi:hypothetical protein